MLILHGQGQARRESVVIGGEDATVGTVDPIVCIASFEHEKLAACVALNVQSSRKSKEKTRRASNLLFTLGLGIYIRELAQRREQ